MLFDAMLCYDMLCHAMRDILVHIDIVVCMRAVSDRHRDIVVCVRAVSDRHRDIA